MGTLIGSRADIGRIEEHVRTAHRRGVARGGAVAELVRGRLGPAIADIDVAQAAHNVAIEAEAQAQANLLVTGERADVAVATVRDNMWNALGRPRQNAFFERVFPEGLGMYTQEGPRLKSVLMQVLVARVHSAPPQLFTKEKVADWVAELEASRKAFDDAVEAHRPTEAAALIARFNYRGAVRAALARLRDLKRDLKTLGLGETTIHDIIPDAGHPSTSADSPPVAPARAA